MQKQRALLLPSQPCNNSSTTLSSNRAFILLCKFILSGSQLLSVTTVGLILGRLVTLLGLGRPGWSLLPGACFPKCIAPEALNPTRKVVHITTRPCAYPVTSFPPSTNSTTLSSTSATLACWEVPHDGSALETAWAAGEVVIAAVAVPITRANVQGGQYATYLAAVSELQIWACGTAALAEVTPAEVEVLAGVAVPVSRLPLGVHSQLDPVKTFGLVLGFQLLSCPCCVLACCVLACLLCSYFLWMVAFL